MFCKRIISGNAKKSRWEMVGVGMAFKELGWVGLG